jgi:hypothetical protein
MRVSGLWSLFGAIIIGLIIADLWANPTVTDSLVTAGTAESQLIAGQAGKK